MRKLGARQHPHQQLHPQTRQGFAHQGSSQRAAPALKNITGDGVGGRQSGKKQAQRTSTAAKWHGTSVSMAEILNHCTHIQLLPYHAHRPHSMAGGMPVVTDSICVSCYRYFKAGTTGPPLLLIHGFGVGAWWVS